MKNNEKDVIAFLPNCVQSIDGYTIRTICYNVSKKTENNYCPEPLHDSLRFHPNFTLIIQKSILDCYYNFPFGLFLKQHLFDENKDVDPKERKKKLLLESKLDFSPLVLDKKTFYFKFKNIYTF